MSRITMMSTSQESDAKQVNEYEHSKINQSNIILNNLNESISETTSTSILTLMSDDLSSNDLTSSSSKLSASCRSSRTNERLSDITYEIEDKSQIIMSLKPQSYALYDHKNNTQKIIKFVAFIIIIIIIIIMISNINIKYNREIEYGTVGKYIWIRDIFVSIFSHIVIIIIPYKIYIAYYDNIFMTCLIYVVGFDIMFKILDFNTIEYKKIVALLWILINDINGLIIIPSVLYYKYGGKIGIKSKLIIIAIILILLIIDTIKFQYGTDDKLSVYFVNLTKIILLMIAINLYTMYIKRRNIINIFAYNLLQIFLSDAIHLIYLFASYCNTKYAKEIYISSVTIMNYVMIKYIVKKLLMMIFYDENCDESNIISNHYADNDDNSIKDKINMYIFLFSFCNQYILSSIVLTSKDFNLHFLILCGIFFVKKISSCVYILNKKKISNTTLLISNDFIEQDVILYYFDSLTSYICWIISVCVNVQLYFYSTIAIDEFVNRILISMIYILSNLIIEYCMWMIIKHHVKKINMFKYYYVILCVVVYNMLRNDTKIIY